MKAAYLERFIFYCRNVYQCNICYYSFSFLSVTGKYYEIRKLFLVISIFESLPIHKHFIIDRNLFVHFLSAALPG